MVSNTTLIKTDIKLLQDRIEFGVLPTIKMLQIRIKELEKVIAKLEQEIKLNNKTKT